MGAQRKKLQVLTKPVEHSYGRIRAIDGSHPFKEEVPGSHVAYKVRRRKNGRVVFFNFELAKEMGLVANDHEHRVSKQLEDALLDTFAIQIINEYDIIHNKKIPDEDIKENPYMATRYLQLQHPNKTGLTSGDGRSIWNGSTSYRGSQWDVTSCGTGATCLSPATALNNKFFRTGDPSVSYGCGYAEVAEGIGTAVFSEIFHKNGINTERTLCVIEFPRGLAITVRAGKNLLRPSHFFNHLKQENYPRLKAAVDYYIKRQVQNRVFDAARSQKDPYSYLLDYIVETFADIAARFESEYIFCWMAWDGDNILTDGGIIDYGSIRQFGLFHHDYRYDDVERWSTTIPEQKNHARYTVQTFAQLTDYLKRGKKKTLRAFSNHHSLKRFDQIFKHRSQFYLLRRIGFDDATANLILNDGKARRALERFEKIFGYFEKKTSSRGVERLEDGITKNAIFCMRDILREFPILAKQNKTPLPLDTFIKIIKSNYATRTDLRNAKHLGRHAAQFQACYEDLLKKACDLKKINREDLLSKIITRSNVINRYERITGDAVVFIADKIAANRRAFTSKELHRFFESFVNAQILNPDHPSLSDEHKSAHLRKPESKRLMKSVLRLVKNLREGI